MAEAQTKPSGGKKVLYEDSILSVIMAEHAMTEGHVQILPKKPVKYFEELSSTETSHMFFVASYCASALFELTKAQGTNIVLNNGKCGLYDEASPKINVIARFTDDSLNFKWKPKQIEGPLMEELANKLSSHSSEKEKSKTIHISSSSPSQTAKTSSSSPSSHYVIEHDHFQRIP